MHSGDAGASAGNAAADDPPAADPVGPAADAVGPMRVTNRQVFGYAVTAALGALVVFLASAAIYALRGRLVQVLVAAFIAVSLDPVVRWLMAHKFRRSWAVTLVFVVFALALAGFLYATVPALVGQANQLGRDFPGYLQHLRDQSPSLARFEDRFHLQPRIEEFARRAPSFLGHEALSVGTRFFGALLTTLLVIVLTIYFMADLPRLRRGIARLFPTRHRARVDHVTNVMIDKVGAYMIGNLIISLIAGASAFLVLMILGVPFALPLAVAVAITDLIPLVGATIGAAICVVVAFATTDLWPNTVVLVLFFVVYQQLENYLIAPRVLRNTVDLPSVAVLLVALVGASMLGLVGALMAIPIAAAVRVVVGPMLHARDVAAEAKQATVAPADGQIPPAGG
ncbi:MAG TPA: AI-2E family transporter [Micromonosporaceae bacterium]|nr:AI-2E family transporter [Micromonosporaceae bacterium]